MHRSIRTFAFAAALLSVGACGDDNGTESPGRYSTTGRWTSDPTTSPPMTVTLKEASGGISGSGTFGGGAGALEVTVFGRNEPNGVSFKVRARGYEDVNFFGRFAGSRKIAGSVTGSGFGGTTMTLIKQ